MDSIFLYIALGALVITLIFIYGDRQRREKRAVREKHWRDVCAENRMID